MESLPPQDLARWCQITLPEDTRAFEALVATYKDRVFATAYRLMGNRHEAEEMCQEVFLKIFRSIKDLAEPATLTSWIYRITTNVCLDALGKRPRRAPSFAPPPPFRHAYEEEHFRDYRQPTPEEVTLISEFRRCLDNTLAQLDPVARSILVLRDIEERSYQEITFETICKGFKTMKNISTLILVLLILTSPVFSQTRGKKGNNAVAAESDEQVIRGLEQQYADALKRRDITVLGRLFAEDFISRPTPERSFNKGERLAAIKSDDVSFEVVGVEDVNVRLYKESAVVLGRITSQGKRKAADFSDNSAYIHVYVKKDGRWQMVASQLSPCAPQL